MNYKHHHYRYEPLKQLAVKDRLRNIIYILERNDSKTVFILTLIWGSIFAYWFWKQDIILSYADALSRLSMARSVTDSLTPGLVNFGSVWLPLPQAAMLLFSWNDFLFYTGLAGMIPSIIAFSLSCIFLYKLSSELFESKKLGIFSLLIYITNINLLYFSSIPMSEIYSLLFLLSSTYFFYKWTNNNSIYFLSLAGFSTMLGTLVRYDMWFIPFYLAFLIALKYAFFSSEKIKFLKIIHTFHKNLKENFHRMEGTILIYLVPAIAGIFGFIIYNWIIYGSPFYFSSSEYSAYAQVKEISFSATKNNILNSALYYSTSAIYLAGPIFLFAIIFCLFYLIKKPNVKTLSVLTLFVPFIFYIYSLYSGQGILWTPNLPPFQAFNLRYGIMMFPFVSIFIPAIFTFIKGNIKKVLSLFLSGLLLVNYMFLFGSGFTPIILVDNTNAGVIQHIISTKNIANEINKNYNDEKTLVTSSVVPWEYLYYSYLPYKKFIIVNNKPIWEEAINAPWNYSKWIIASKSPAYIKDDPGVKIFDSKTIDWMYETIYNNQSTKLLKLNESRIPPNITGYFSMENFTVKDNKIQFLFLNYADAQPSINITTRCPDTYTEIPFYLPNVTQLEGDLITLPLIPGCKEETLAITGFNYEINRIIKQETKTAP